MAKYPQKHLHASEIQMTGLAIDTIGCLPVMSKGNRWALTTISLHTSYVFKVSMKEKSPENVVKPIHLVY